MRIKFISDKEVLLMAPIKVEGANTPADLLLTVDADSLLTRGRFDRYFPDLLDFSDSVQMLLRVCATGCMAEGASSSVPGACWCSPV